MYRFIVSDHVQGLLHDVLYEIILDSLHLFQHSKISGHFHEYKGLPHEFVALL